MMDDCQKKSDGKITNIFCPFTGFMYLLHCKNDFMELIDSIDLV